jgi:hypothetical protein
VSVIQAGTLRLEGIVSSFEDISGAGNLEVGGSASSLLSARSIATNSLRIGGASAYSPQPTGAPASVPEPSTAMLAIGVGLGLLFVFRRR